MLSATCLLVYLSMFRWVASIIALVKMIRYLFHMSVVLMLCMIAVHHLKIYIMVRNVWIMQHKEKLRNRKLVMINYSCKLDYRSKNTTQLDYEIKSTKQYTRSVQKPGKLFGCALSRLNKESIFSDDDC